MGNGNRNRVVRIKAIILLILVEWCLVHKKHWIIVTMINHNRTWWLQLLLCDTITSLLIREPLHSSPLTYSLILLLRGCPTINSNSYSKLSLSPVLCIRMLWLQVMGNPNKSSLNNKGNYFSLITRSLEVGWIRGWIIQLPQCPQGCKSFLFPQRFDLSF